IKTTEEGGANETEYRLRYASDRVRTTAAAWLGVTLGCAECHDHKSDPFTLRDFYSFSAFFADLDEPGVGKRRSTLLSTPDQAVRLEAVAQKLDEALARLEAIKAAVMPDRDKGVQELHAAYGAGRLGWKPVNYRGFAAKDERRFEPREAGSIFVRGPER